MSFAAFRDGLLRDADEAAPKPLNLVVLERIDSTNRLARRIAGEYLKESLFPPNLIVAAYEQVAGRGRLGRSWVSPRGQGVYLTMLRGVSGAEELQTLPLLVAVGLARQLSRHLAGLRCDLKWPNDLLVRGRKLGGILIEVATAGDRCNEEAGGAAREAVALIGFGINHRFGEDELPIAGATSLAMEGATEVSTARLARELVVAVEEELSHLGDASYAMRCYEELSLHRKGEWLRCRVGDETFEGTFLGFDPRGFLRLEVEGRERKIAAGEVLES